MRGSVSFAEIYYSVKLRYIPRAFPLVCLLLPTRIERDRPLFPMLMDYLRQSFENGRRHSFRPFLHESCRTYLRTLLLAFAPFIGDA
jgi:hypothetical protein